jgi:hypothetical protein
MKFREWSHGQVVAHVIDYRYADAREFHVCLTLSNDVLLYCREKVDSVSRVEFERRALLLMHPHLYVASERSGARYFSLADQRQKMWIKGGPSMRLTGPEEDKKKEKEFRIPPPARVEQKRYQKVQLPDRILALFTKANTRTDEQRPQ